MKLEGSCHCQAVRFTCECEVPIPYARCYCSICRKTAGGGAYAINLDAFRKSLRVEGRENLSVYRARLSSGKPGGRPEKSALRRYFCKQCGSALWAGEPDSDYIHPFASAIDTPMPKPKANFSIMLDYAVPWSRVPAGRNDLRAGGYGEREYDAWAKKHGLYED
jgi:hypothetical protein